MAAIVQSELGDASVLRLGLVTKPVALPTEVLVRVHASGVNPVDWKTRAGGGVAGVLGTPPFVLGWDVSGVVEEVGFGVTTLAPGDEVFGMLWLPRQAGAYAEYVTAPARQFAKKPATLDHIHAAAVPLAALTAWQVLVDTARIQRGQRVLIHAGAGGVGHIAIQIARHFGAHVTTTASATNHAWLRDLGADDVIDYTSQRFEDSLSGLDVVFDLVDDAETGVRSVSSLAPEGLIVAAPSGASPELLAAASSHGVRATGFFVEPDGHALARIAEFIDAGELSVVVETSYPLADAAKAHQHGERGHTRGKLVLSVTD